VGLAVTGVNSAPNVSFTGPAPTAINDNQTGHSVRAVNISDSDAGDTVTIQITFPSGARYFSSRRWPQ